MAKKSAGILLYRFTKGIFEVLIVHPGGPYWAKKDKGAWSIPKGEFDDKEDPLEAAIREFNEELGLEIKGDFISLTPVKQPGGKTVFAYAVEKDFDNSGFTSNTFSLEWPPNSGKIQEFPEVDKAGWYDYETSKRKINKAQAVIIEELAEKLNLKKDQFKSKP
ncbi:MAG: NUDIX domain-containing protein [Bacteroidota bacterium]|nr:NUDIX domain-containing protein [Bacteroidota bacterium]